MSRDASVVARFRESMTMDVDRWRDGIGYDVASLGSATAVERAQIEAMLLAHGVLDWRDVEALAALDTPSSRTALQAALAEGNPVLSEAVARYAPHLLGEDGKIAALVHVLEHGTLGGGGLIPALLQVESFHPPAVEEALLRGILRREHEVAVAFVSRLYFVRGLAKSSFDWAHRPFFLTFGTDDPAARELAFRELCKRIGVDAERYISDQDRQSTS